MSIVLYLPMLALTESSMRGPIIEIDRHSVTELLRQIDIQQKKVA